MNVVVDTNVAIVANGHSEQASLRCVGACSRRLGEIVKSGTLVLDDQWLIINEYKNKLRSSGQPGVGDAFLKWVLTNWGNPQRCALVRITSRNDSAADFEEFPEDERLTRFDPADRKFIAVACAHTSRPRVLQAVDAKWWAYRHILQENNVTVEFLCDLTAP